MSTVGRHKGMTSDYDGEHDFHFTITPACERPRWFLEDVPDFVRIDHPNRRPFVAGPGSGRTVKPREQRKAQAPAHQNPTPERTAGGSTGKPVWVYQGGMVTGYPQIQTAKAAAKFSFAVEAQARFSNYGWVALPKKGVVVWLQSRAYLDGKRSQGQLDFKAAS